MQTLRICCSYTTEIGPFEEEADYLEPKVLHTTAEAVYR